MRSSRFSVLVPAFGLGLIVVLAACSSAVPSEGQGEAASTANSEPNEAPFAACTGDLSSRRFAEATGIALTKACIEQAAHGATLSIVPVGASASVGLGAAEHRVETDPSGDVLTYWLTQNVEEGSPLAKGLPVGTEVRTIITLRPEPVLEDEDMPAHFIGEVLWDVLRPGATERSMQRLDDIHFYSEHPDHPLHWSYKADRTGPKSWGNLGFETCGRGHEQTPIALSVAADTSLDVERRAVELDWKPVVASVVNNGHTLQANVGPGSALVVDGERYELLQFHVHTPSEHVFDGNPAGMEVHFVHQAKSGKRAVVGVLVDTKGPDSASAERFLASFPHDGKKGIVDQPIELDAPLDPRTLLPQDRAMYTYRGSLTTPPCSEGIEWFVFKSRIVASEQQRSRVEGMIGGQNARPVQPIGARRVSLLPVR